MASEPSLSSTYAQFLSDAKTIAAAGDLAHLQSKLKEFDDLEPVGDSWSHDWTLHEKKKFMLQYALDEAARAGHVEFVACLLKQYNCSPSSEAVRGAIGRKHWDTVELLFESGWDINQSVGGGNTLPVMCLFLNSEEKVQWLLEHGADPMIRSAGRNNHMASRAGMFSPPRILKILRAHGTDFTQSNALHQAVTVFDKGQRIEAMAYLLDEAGVPIDMLQWEWDSDFFHANKSMGFGTALHVAVRGKKTEYIEFLFKRGADPLAKNTNGQSVFDLAREDGFEEELSLLKSLTKTDC